MNDRDFTLPINYINILIFSFDNKLGIHLSPLDGSTLVLQGNSSWADIFIASCFRIPQGLLTSDLALTYMRQKKTSFCDPLVHCRFLRCSLNYFTRDESNKAGYWLSENSTLVGIAPFHCRSTLQG